MIKTCIDYSTIIWVKIIINKISYFSRVQRRVSQRRRPPRGEPVTVAPAADSSVQSSVADSSVLYTEAWEDGHTENTEQQPLDSKQAPG